jgi:quercetin dioxygenase-like cupin family protein
MKTSLTRSRPVVRTILLLAAEVWLAGSASGVRGQEIGAVVKPVRAEKLPNVPGKTLTAVAVSYAPGGKSSAHRHAGSVFVYVLTGAIRSENSATGPAKVYRAGETFFEPPGSEHLVSENASATEPASLLAVFVADDGAQLTTFGK